VPDLEFNGKKANTELDGYLQSVKYTDVADGESDTIDITLQNIEKRWLKGWWPKKKDVIVAKFKFKNWNKTGDSLLFRCGRFTLDSVKYSGGPIICEMSAAAMPKSSKFQSRKRTQTWKDVTLKQVGQRIAKRYNLGFRYDAKMVKISKLEQSEEDDCSFLKKLAEKYDLGMKIYRSKIVIWDKGRYERRKPIAYINRKMWVDDDWSFDSSLEGVYTGCRVTYKDSKSKKKDVNVYVGVKDEHAKGARTLKINESCSSAAEARQKAAAKVNESNENAMTLEGTIFPNPKICAGCTVRVKGIGKANGKYFIDKMTLEVSGDKTTQRLEMHKVQKRCKG
jgi:phage protein D